MKKNGFIWSVALLLTLGLGLLCGGQANAQSRGDNLPELTRDWTLRLGLFIPNSETARRAVGDVGLSAIGERTVYAGIGYDVNLGIAYNGMDRVYSVPLTVTFVARQHKLRYGVAAGYAFGKRVDGRGTSGPVLGLMGGWHLRSGNNPLDVQLRYNFISGSDNELDGYSLTLGIRF